MTSRFFRLVIRLVPALAVLAATSFFGQSPAPSPTARPKVGNLRLWNMQPLGSPNLDLVIGTNPGTPALQTASPCNYYAGYTPLPPASYAVTVFRAGDRSKPLATFNVVLRRDAYLTILASQPPGRPTTAELVDDTPDPEQPPTNRLTVRVFCPDLRAQVTTTSRQNTDVLGSGQAQILSGLPGGMVPVTMHATLANGSAKEWTAEADFHASRHASLLVFADPYGRIRPRVTVDGPSPQAEDATAAEITPKAP